MKQYRKKPVTIEAVQFDGLNPTEIKDFVGENCEVEIYDNEVTPPVARIVIHTLEGDMEVSKGDYVIKGVKGEFYPCKPNIFERTYESEEPDKILEEAALLYSSPMGRKDPEHLEEYPYSPADKAAFIAGAEWQKAKMMEKAVDGRVYKSYNVVHESGEPSFHGIELVYPDMDKPYIIAGDTVKVIFIPEKSEKVK